MIDTYGIGALIDAFADLLREFHGDLKAPWDSAPGSFNHHDRAAMDRFHRQMPHLAAKFDHYFKFNNLLDEFNSPAGPIVLFNVDMEVRLDALKKYPLLYDFYRKLVPAVVAKSDIIGLARQLLDARGVRPRPHPFHHHAAQRSADAVQRGDATGGGQRRTQ